MDFDPSGHRYPSIRNLVYGGRAMAATSSHLASNAALRIMDSGGNAVDGAIAAAAVLTVAEPTSNGIGSDLFAIVWQNGRLYGLNASGQAPSGFKPQEGGHIAQRGWQPVTIPGAPAGWAALSRRLGKLPFARLLEPAIDYAENGFAVGVTVSQLWRNACQVFSKLTNPVHKPFWDVFFPQGRAPRPGELFKSPAHASTLERIAAGNAADFYDGKLAEQIMAYSDRSGGYFKEGDLRDFAPAWLEPISVRYGNYDIWELPPNGQGLVALQALKIMNCLERTDHDDCRTIHNQVEAVKLAFADAKRYICDPDFRDIPFDALLDDDYIASRRALISDFAQNYQAGTPYSGGTVYLCTADENCMVSLIQSNYMGFGSGVLIPGTGIALNNRGCNFSTDPSHPNFGLPHKRPYNTIIPGFITDGPRPVGPFGVMGAFMQPQGHLQAVMNMIDFHMNPQEALDAPRWQWTGDLDVSFEAAFSNHAIEKLSARGHRTTIAPDSLSFGRGQIIAKTASNTLVGATDPRADGAVCAM